MKFRGVNLRVSSERIPQGEREESKHYYECRHSDSSTGIRTVEKRVVVNYWGTLICDNPLDLGPEGYIDLTAAERRSLSKGRQ